MSSLFMNSGGWN